MRGTISAGTDMKFSVRLPDHAAGVPLPVVRYRSGLTCTRAEVTDRGKYSATCAGRGPIFVAPDTGPRGDGITDDSAGTHDSGLGAGLYNDANQTPCAATYRMWRYAADKRQGFVAAHILADVARQSIPEHSIDRHGALITDYIAIDEKTGPRFAANIAWHGIVAKREITFFRTPGAPPPEPGATVFGHADEAAQSDAG